MDFSVSGAVNAVKNGYKATTDAVTNTASAAANAVVDGAQAARDTVMAHVPTSIGDVGEMLLDVAPYTPMNLALLGAGGFAKAAQFAYDYFTSGATKADTAFLKETANKVDPATLANLKKLADQGKLSAMDRDGQTLRGVWEGLEKARTDPALLAALAKQLADPGQIHQMRENTCSAAAIQEALAVANPAMYARLATQLTQPPYQATLPNGKQLQVSEANRAWIEAQNFSPEDRINAYMQAALMDYANGGATYNMADDTTVTTMNVPFFGNPLEFLSQGMNITQAQGMADALGNVPIINPNDVAGRNAGERNAQLRTLLARAKKDGAPGFLLPVKGPNGRLHMVMVTGIDPKSGAVTVYDPAHGRSTTIPQDKFDAWVAWHVDAWDEIGTLGASSGTGGGVRGR